MKEYFLIIDFDGWNVGLREFFNETYLVFDCFDDAKAVATHWDNFINGYT